MPFECGFKTRMRWSLFEQKAASCFAFMWAGLRLNVFIHSGFAFRPPCTQTRWLCLSTAMHPNASCKKALKYFGGTNSRCAAGHAGASEIFILGKFNTDPCTPRSARFPRIPPMARGGARQRRALAHITRLDANQRKSEVRGFVFFVVHGQSPGC